MAGRPSTNELAEITRGLREVSHEVFHSACLSSTRQEGQKARRARAGDRPSLSARRWLWREVGEGRTPTSGPKLCWMMWNASRTASLSVDMANGAGRRRRRRCPFRFGASSRPTNRHTRQPRPALLYVKQDSTNGHSRPRRPAVRPRLLSLMYLEGRRERGASSPFKSC